MKVHNIFITKVALELGMFRMGDDGFLSLVLGRGIHMHEYIARCDGRRWHRRRRRRRDLYTPHTYPGPRAVTLLVMCKLHQTRPLLAGAFLVPHVRARRVWSCGWPCTLSTVRIVNGHGNYSMYHLKLLQKPHIRCESANPLGNVSRIAPDEIIRRAPSNFVHLLYH